MKSRERIERELAGKRALNPHFNRAKRSSIDDGKITYVTRDPCFWCGTKRDVGCKHYPKTED